MIDPDFIPLLMLTYHANSGLFQVKGESLSERITFSKVLYTVTFTESGLPSEATWYVNLSNSMKSGEITGSSYTISLSNGSYLYTISTPNKIYKPSIYSGSITVSGENVLEPVTFSKVLYTVTFTESNLPQGSTWTLRFNNIQYTLTNTSYSFHY